MLMLRMMVIAILNFKSKPRINVSNKNAILIFLFLTTLFFHFQIKQKPDVRIKVIPLVVFFLYCKFCKTSSIIAADPIFFQLN